MGVSSSAADVRAWIASNESEMVERLLHLSAINSGTGNLGGLAKVCNEYHAPFAELADSIEVLKSKPLQRVNHLGQSFSEEYGDIISCVKRPNAPFQVLLVGHMDTVFPKDHHFQTPTIVDENMIHGPGVADMKGGILVMLNALRAFENSQTTNQLGWRVILNADEETGSHGSAELLHSAAKNAHAGLIYEPALADGTLAGARKGSGNFTLVAKGLAAHAGREFSKGRNAIVLMAEAAQTLAKLSNVDRGITVNVARVSGGTVFNVVPDQAVCQFNIRCDTVDDQKSLAASLAQIVNELNGRDGFSVELSGSFSRPPKVITGANKLLMDWVVECGRAIDVDVTFKNTGGCCDGNNLADAGLANVDTLGVLGAHIHTDQEYMLTKSLVERTELSYLLLDKLSRQGEQMIAVKSKES
ncbi:MAG: hydrolase [Pseudohongiellaceae bacterium]